MSFHQPATRRRRPVDLCPSCPSLAAVVALGASPGAPRPAVASTRHRPAASHASPASPRPSARARPGGAPATPPTRTTVARSGVADGDVPDGATVFDDDYPAVANLDPHLLAALRAAATDAADDGVEFRVNSGWRSAAYQEQLLDEAVAKYGSARGGRPLGRHARHVRRTCRETRSTSAGSDGHGLAGGARRRATGCARSTGTSRGTTSCAPRRSSDGCPASTPTPRTTRGCSGDPPAVAGQEPPGRPVRGLPRPARVDRALEARRPLGRRGADGEAGAVRGHRRGRSQRAPRGRRQPAALRPLRPLPRPARAVVAVVGAPGCRGRGEPGPRGRPVRAGRRPVGQHRRRRQHGRRPGRPGSGRRRPARVGGQGGPGHDPGLLGRRRRSPSSSPGSTWRLRASPSTCATSGHWPGSTSPAPFREGVSRNRCAAGQPVSTAMASMETSRPRGSRTFAGAERAGGGSGMCRA